MRLSLKAMSVPGRGHRRQREARRVGAKALDDVERIDHIALGLRHLLALGVAHQRVNVDLAEGNAVVFLVRPSAGGFHRRILLMPLHEVAAEHDHARHPEEQDLVGGDQQRGGIENFLVARLLRPAQRRERQQTRRKTRCRARRGILLQLGAAALRAFRRRFAGDR